MNGYVVTALHMALIAIMWCGFGSVAGIITATYVVIISVALARYNTFIFRVVNIMRQDIESLTGRPYTGPED